MAKRRLLGKLISFGALLTNMWLLYNLILCHCIVVLFELCIDNNQIQIFFFFLPATRVSFDGMPVRETYIQIGMAL